MIHQIHQTFFLPNFPAIRTTPTPTFYIKELCLFTNVQQLRRTPNSEMSDLYSLALAFLDTFPIMRFAIY